VISCAYPKKNECPDCEGDCEVDGEECGLCRGTGREMDLPHCITDGDRMQNYLNSKGFNVTRMRDDIEDSDELYPTEENMKRKIEDLANNANNGDIVWLYFTGHGSNGKVKKGHTSGEVDNRNEKICPTPNSRGEGEFIQDNWLNENFVQNLSKGVVAVAMFDSCHSGTILDLPYSYTGYDEDGDSTTEWSNPSRSAGNRSGAVVLCLSGCTDKQCTTQGSDENYDGETTSYLTAAFLNNHEDANNIEDLLDRIQKAVDDEADPILSCSHEIKVDQHFSNIINHTVEL